MQRSRFIAKNIGQRLLYKYNNNQTQILRPPCDIFINHRGIDTKRTISGLLYNHLSNLGFNPFLDSKNMKPGDKLFDKINKAIGECRLGVAVFSPRYCDSYFCLHELALIVESKKRFIPIFSDVKPSELSVKDNGSCPQHELQKFRDALEEAKYTVGLTFDSNRGDWTEFLTQATDAIIENFMEMDQEQVYKVKKPKHFVQRCYH